MTKYLKQKKRRGIQYYERCLEIFIESELDEEASSDFVLILGGITSPKDMKELITHKMNSSSETDDRLLRKKLNLVDKIYCTLYKFSFSKFSRLAKYPAMHHLLIHFSNKNLNLLSDDERIGLRIFINKWKKYEDLNN